MKLRILGDSVRLRLSQSEVRTLTQRGTVEETTHFAGTTALGYAIELVDEGGPMRARHDDGRIVIELSRAEAERWADGEDVGMSATHGALSILVEKDFQCLAPREGQGDEDAFPHPLAGKAEC